MQKKLENDTGYLFLEEIRGPSKNKNRSPSYNLPSIILLHNFKNDISLMYLLKINYLCKKSKSAKTITFSKHQFWSHGHLVFGHP